MTERAGWVPGLDVLPENQAHGGVAGSQRGNDGAVEGFEHFRGILVYGSGHSVRMERNGYSLKEVEPVVGLRERGLQDRHSQDLVRISKEDFLLGKGSSQSSTVCTALVADMPCPANLGARAIDGKNEYPLIFEFNSMTFCCVTV